jgi:hypothetical protein
MDLCGGVVRIGCRVVRIRCDVVRIGCGVEYGWIVEVIAVMGLVLEFGELLRGGEQLLLGGF